jgi:hypothetical protein
VLNRSACDTYIMRFFGPWMACSRE